MRVDCTGLLNVDDCIHANDVLHVRSHAQLSYEEAVEVVYAHLDAGSSADAAAAALVQVCKRAHDFRQYRRDLLFSHDDDVFP
jgi:hypothetical protein